jgi:DNA polymerase
MPADLAALLANPQVIWVFHNSIFDWTVFIRCLKVQLPIERVRCTRAQAYAHGLPGSLEMLGKVLGLAEDESKLVEDKKLIDIFCKPHDDAGHFYDRSTHPAEWDRFCKYAMRDTEALRAIHQKLPGHNYQGDNLATWHLDQLINQRGFGFDSQLAMAARQTLTEAKGLQAATVQSATEGEVRAATQRARLLKWLREKGYDMPNLRAATVREMLEHDDLDPLVRLVLETRLESAKNSGAKYARGMNLAGKGDRLRFAIQFSGAGRTGRFAHKGFQPGNMARPTAKRGFIESVVIPGILNGDVIRAPFIYGGPQEACANALRSSIIAAPGNEQVVADFSNVESRVLAWLAGEGWKVEAYKAVDRGEGVDLYKLLFSSFFGIPPGQVDDHQRQAGKVSELAFGFGGGVGALVAMAAAYNMDLDAIPAMILPNAKPEMLAKARKAWRRAFLSGEDYGLEPDVYVACDILKQVYRASNPAINQMRYDVDNAVKGAIRNPGQLFEVARCKIWATATWLVIELPSGRRLLYNSPQVRSKRTVDPETGKEGRPQEYVSYLTTRGQSWIREAAWAGLFVENIVQAVANDLLRDALRAVHADTLTVPAIVEYLNTLPEEARTAIHLHVHDEAGVDVPKGSYPLKRLLGVLTTASYRWARGLPIAAAGWVGYRYGK